MGSCVVGLYPCYESPMANALILSIPDLDGSHQHVCVKLCWGAPGPVPQAINLFTEYIGTDGVVEDEAGASLSLTPEQAEALAGALLEAALDAVQHNAENGL